MGWEAKVGSFLAKTAAKVGVKRFFRPSLKLSEIDFEPIRRPGDDLNEGPAIVYTIDVTNEGSKIAEKSRGYLQAEGVWEPGEDGEFVEFTREGNEVEIDADRVDFSLNTQVFWSDGIQAKDHFRSDVDVDAISKKSLSPGETATLSFAIVIGGNENRDPTIRFGTKDGFEHSAIPEIKFDGLPYKPGVAGEPENEPDSYSVDIPVKELDRYDWAESRIYVTSENTNPVEFNFNFFFFKDHFAIKHESYDVAELKDKI